MCKCWLLASIVSVISSERHLGFVIDSRLTMADHSALVCRSVYYHLRQIRPTLRSLSEDSAKMLLHAFISSRLDYRNARHHQQFDLTTANSTDCSNKALRLIARRGRLKHIVYIGPTPVLREMHYSVAVSIRRRVELSSLPVMGKSKIKFYCQISNQSINRFKSFGQISNPIFFSNLKSFSD